MITVILAAQLLSTQPAYASPALRDLVDLAATGNRSAPASLHEYRAQVESEIAVLTRRADGEEGAVSLEQARNDVHWQRDGAYEQHVVAYRGRQSGPSLSALAVLRTAWTIPTLYGNSLGGLMGRTADGGRGTGEGRASARATRSMHPFAAERESVYRFSGGDTIAVLETSRRAIAIVRVMVAPRTDLPTGPLVVFRGEIDLDAERGEIVRMRGQFVTMENNRAQRRRLVVLPVRIMAYVDLESVEVNGRYWLPRYQRIETHVNIGGLAEGRTVFRIVSRFRGHEVRTGDGGRGTGDDEVGGVGHAEIIAEHRLTLATSDSLRAPGVWWESLGAVTAGLRGDDFADVGAERFSLTGPAGLAWRAQRLADVVRFNRVEGWSTGAAAEFVPGARVPGVTLRGNVSWAWTERTIRGRMEAIRRAEDWSAGVRLGRTLDITNDFTAPHDSGGTMVAALASVDDYDYVARTSATTWLNLDLLPRKATLRVEAGIAADRGERARLTRGLVRGEAPFRPNRGVDAGTYARLGLAAEWNPGVNANPLSTGLGAAVRYEAAAGRLDWQRTTVRVTARTDAGLLSYAARIDGGMLRSLNAPPQQLFELGGGPGFPGYDYKAFAGDRALAAHARASVRLPVLRSPTRVLGCTCFTSPAPELALTLHGAALSASSATARASIARLGTAVRDAGVTSQAPSAALPVSRPTGGLKSSVEIGLRLFGGAATLGVARANAAGAPWRASFTLGQSW